MFDLLCYRRLLARQDLPDKACGRLTRALLAAVQAQVQAGRMRSAAKGLNGRGCVEGCELSLPRTARAARLWGFDLDVPPRIG